MMEYQEQLKIQACLDGELPEAEAREVAARVARDPEAAGLMQELRYARQALAAGKAPLQLPESREFFWSKIEREIEREEAARAAEPVRTPLLVRLRRLLVPAAAVALFIMAGVLAIRPGRPPVGTEISLADPGAFTYRDFVSGTTLVWLSYPAENGIAEDDKAANFD